MKAANKSQKGVTLVETLVALAVMGFVIGALLVLIGQNSRFTAAMRDRTMASIAADNLMVEALILRETTEAGDDAGDITIGGNAMRYRRTVITTGVDDVVRIDIEIFAPETEQRLAHAVSMRRAR